MNDLSSAAKSSAAPIDFRQLARGIGTVITYGVGDIIFREGDPPSYAYMVLTGKVEISSRNKTIEIVGEGRSFGVVSIIDKNPRLSEARALEYSEIALLDPRQFRFMVETMPNFVWYVLSEIVERLRATNSAL